MQNVIDIIKTQMLRRGAVSILLGAPAWASGSLDRYLDAANGAAVLVEVPTGRRIDAVGAERVAPPGSTIKPFVLAALLRSGRLRATDGRPCPRRLRIAGRTLDCAHPEIAAPMRADTALAYSCNCFVAWAAERFAPGELAAELKHAGFTRVRSANPSLQALGEDGVLVTAMELAMAYRSLALQLDRAELQPVAAGLEGAVEYGTGQHAAQRDVKAAGKTGSTQSAQGELIAWFAGFLPSRAPQVAIAVMMRGRSGGSDAAPVAGKILEAYRAGRL